METSTKVLLLLAMYGLPVCLVMIYRIRENLKQKRELDKGKYITSPGRNHT